MSEETAADERRGMRAHDEHGNVRPADGRWELHAPEDEFEATSGDREPETTEQTKTTRKRGQS